MLNVIDRIANNEIEPFIAPIITSNKVRILTIQNEIPYWFFCRAIPGWYLIKELGDHNKQAWANIVRVATSVERLKYLEQLPTFHVIPLFIDQNGENEFLWVMPFNIADAAQRGWPNGEPRPAYLFSINVDMFSEVITVRNLAGTLLGEGVANIRLDINSPEAKISKKIIEDKLKHVAKKQKEVERLEKLQSIEGRIDESLKLSGAELINAKMNLSGEYKIEWMFNGNGYTTTVDKDLRVLSAGVCLDGNDNWYSLNSIVHVMEDRRQAINNGSHGDY